MYNYLKMEFNEIKILKEIDKETENSEIYHRVILAYDDKIEKVVLLEDFTKNLSEDRCGLSWSELCNDCDFAENLSYDCKDISSGIYEVEFIAWGYQEPHTESGYGDGDGDNYVISYQKLDYTLK